MRSNGEKNNEERIKTAITSSTVVQDHKVHEVEGNIEEDSHPHLTPGNHPIGGLEFATPEDGHKSIGTTTMRLVNTSDSKRNSVRIIDLWCPGWDTEFASEPKTCDRKFVIRDGWQ